ncbi:coniferyl-alcohol dehydrogenase [Mycobacterium sp. MYCO198283]|uniref:coniferyl-alcohol dehydrogenase n=1 Tax=Mycobacterium sp. MYCO198283 TaxID=2883505 RepID=UPI001E657A3A|nr:coniferyl-alcohol dehydrogenase [Mycobacterium sp. MYCO198283]MCG5434207.1 coniferyl-alcohol dehydrogenase [Mycobacterium sp. MYCO198283]
MPSLPELLRFDGRRVVVTGCSSGIGASVAAQLSGLGAEVFGLDLRPPAAPLAGFSAVDLADPATIDAAVAGLPARVDVLCNVAGVSSGIGDPLLVATINFLGTRHLTEAVLPRMSAGSAIVSVSSLAAAAYRENLPVTAGLVRTAGFGAGLAWCREHPEALADGGYRLSKEALILWTMAQAEPLGARGIRINCTAPGVTDTPILDQLRSAYGQEYLDGFTSPLGRSSEPEEQTSVLVFLAGRAASYLTGQVVWVDGGISAARVAAQLALTGA